MTTLRTTGRESKADAVLRLYTAGWSAIRIANALNMSPQGVYWHLDRLHLPAPSQRDETKT
jgi:DNA-binding CsgD family transcriptional regulator